MIEKPKGLLEKNIMIEKPKGLLENEY